jgi:hypothetical protein
LLRLRAPPATTRDTESGDGGGPGWRVLAKSTAPRHERSVIPARDAASDASFEGVS